MGVALHRSFPWIDYVCSGEGDLAFPELVRALRASPGGGQTGLQIDGIISRDGAETKRPAEMTKPVKNLDLLLRLRYLFGSRFALSFDEKELYQ